VKIKIYLTPDFVRVQRSVPRCRCCCLACCHYSDTSDVLLQNINAVSRVSADWSQSINLCYYICCICGCHRKIVSDYVGYAIKYSICLTLLSNKLFRVFLLLVLNMCLLYYFGFIGFLGFLISVARMGFQLSYLPSSIIENIMLSLIGIAVVLLISIIDFAFIAYECGFANLHLAVNGSIKDYFLLNMGTQKKTQAIMNWIFAYQGFFRERNLQHVVLMAPVVND
jgi:hypothetical protein